MDARGERIRYAEIVSRRAANRHAQTTNLKVLSRAIRIFDDQFSHYLVPSPRGRGVQLTRFRVGGKTAPPRRITTVPEIKSCSARPVGTTVASKKPKPNGIRESG